MNKGIIYTMVKYVLGIGLVFMFNGTTFAQQHPSKEDRAAKELEMMKKDLTLTADQEAKVKTLLTNYAAKEKDLQAASKEDREANKTKRNELQTQKDAELKAILTADQYQKLQDKKKEHPEGGKSGHGDGDHHKGGQGSH